MPNFIDTTLEEELRFLAKKFSTEKLKIETGFFPPKDKNHLSNIHNANIFRIVQELLINTSKHADASNARIILTKHPKHINLTYEDNGKGYKPGTVSKNKGYYDLMNNINSLKGTYSDSSEPGIGTEWTFIFPK